MTLPPQTRREARAAREAEASAVAVTPDPSEPPVAPVPEALDTGSVAVRKGSSVLFGRGLLYVVVWSMQLVVSSLISPVLAHLMPPAEFGVLASAIALYQALVVLAVIGMDQASVLQRAEDGDDRKARGLMAVGMVTASLVTVLALTTIPVWGDAAGFIGNHPLLLVAVLWTGPAAIVQISLALLVAQDRIRVFALTSLLSSIGGSIIGLGLLTWVQADATTYAWGGVVAQVAAMVIGITATRPRFAGLFDTRTMRRAFRLGIPITLGNLSYFVLNVGDRLVVQRLLGPDEVARYQIAYVVGSAVILLLTFTNNAWAPHFAAVRDAVARRQLAMHSRDELYRLLAPVLLAVTLVSPVALPILAPASYRVQELTVVVFVVAVTAFPVVASGATGRLLLVERRGVAVGVIAAIAGAVNIGANLVFVPLMGIAGAAVATVIAYVVLAALQQAALPDRREWRGPGIRLVLTVVRVARHRRRVGLRATGHPVELGPGRRCARLCPVVLHPAARSPRERGMRRVDGSATPPDTGARRSLRVGVVTNGLAITGGVERCVLEDTRDLVAAGHDVTVWHRPVPAGRDDDGRAAFARLDVRLVRADDYRFGVRTAIRDAARFARQGLRMRRSRLDVLWLNRPEFLPFGRVVSIASGVPLAVHLHHAPNYRRLGPIAGGRTRYFAVSHAMARAWSAVGVPADRITVVSNGVDTTAFPPPSPQDVRAARVALGIDEATPTVLYYGRLTRAKGVLAVLEAWGRVLASAAARVPVTATAGPAHPRRAPLLVLAGALPAEEADDVRRAIAALPADSVLVVPERDDVVPLLHAADMVVAPSLEPEGFGRVVVEAMSAGRPVVAAASGGTGEILSGEWARFTVDPSDVDALAERLLDTLDEAVLDPTLGERCRAWVQHRYDRAQHVEALLRALDDTAR